MFETITNLIKASRPLQFAIVFVAGGTVAALFYPTKHIEEKLQETYQSQISTLKEQQAKEVSSIQTESDKKVQELTQTNVTLSSRVTELTNQVSNLKTSSKKNYTKITHPDGTIEVREISTKNTDSEVTISTQVQSMIDEEVTAKTSKISQDYESKISQMTKDWSSKEQSYQSQISTLTQSKSVTINPKNFSLDVGVLTNMDYYGHITYDIWGPFILGIQGQFGSSPAAGAGLGLRF